METQKKKIKIAIIILNWNGKEWLQKFLPTLVENSNDATVFLADNGSYDDSLFFIKKEFPSVRIIENNENLGFAGGYNKALTHIQAKYYVLVNSDLEVAPAWLSPIISLMDRDKNIAACQPKIIDYNNRKRFEYAGASGGYIDNLGYPFCRGRIFNHLEEDKGQYNDLKEVFWATGACLFLRSDAFWAVGGFDASFFAHQEEIDLCWRMKNNGFKIMVQPQSIVYHVGGGTLNSGSSFKTYLNFRNNLYMLFKNLPAYYLFFIIPIRLFLDGIAAISFLAKKKGVSHFLSVIKAHFAFYFAIPKLIAKRYKITQQNKLVGKMEKSILVRNKLKGINIFSDL
tara:strand:+ start:32 stop:1054 length:1023 start_codon:yes stop_codon:yes gene_type:complete